MIEKIKQSLRVTSNYFDNEVTDLIEAAKEDLRLSGVKVDIENALIQRAITIYCKAHFGYDNKDADRLIRAYDSLKIHLVIVGSDL